MKHFPVPFLSALLALSVSLRADPSGLLVHGRWTHGFEAAEGYRAGQPAAGAHVSLTGGTATILDQGAAEGSQFLRFVPSQADDALALKLPAAGPAAGHRTITFAARLPDTAQATRLVLSQGWTLALRPVPGGLEIETGELPPRSVSLALQPGGWLALGLREHTAGGTWDLLVADRPVFTGLPLQPAPAALTDLLIFADGALDLDAIALTAGSGEAGGESIAPSAETAGRTSPRLTAAERGGLISRALAAARDGDMALMSVSVDQLVRRDQTASSYGLEAAQLLAMIGFALRDGGLHEQGAALGRLALDALESDKADAAENSLPADLRASREFVAAQINEQLLGDANEATRRFQQALAFKPDHLGAQGGMERLARQREFAAKDQAIASQGTLAGSGPGGGK